MCVRACRAFGRVVQLEPEDGEAWSNLASVYIRLRRLEHAFQALQEGLKHAHDNWKMWENYLFVSMDVGQLAYALQAFGRLLELRGGQHLDYALLQMLCDAIKAEDKSAAFSLLLHAHPHSLTNSPGFRHAAVSEFERAAAEDRGEALVGRLLERVRLVSQRHRRAPAGLRDPPQAIPRRPAARYPDASSCRSVRVG